MTRLLYGIVAGLAGLLMALSPAQARDPLSPTQTVALFDGKSLTGWTKWLKETGHEDPQNVFAVVDGTIRAGDEDNGYLATDQAYRDYVLSLEFKWGRRNPDAKYVRNSGVLIHGLGPHGSAGSWMTSIECQLAQGCEGDLIVIRGEDSQGKPRQTTISSRTRVAEDKRTRWDPQGKPVKYSGRQFWWSQHQPFFKEHIDTRGKNDVASPLGQWTRVEIQCSGDRGLIKINGKPVNGFFDASPEAGRILLQAEGHEVYFRNVELRPLPKADADP